MALQPMNRTLISKSGRIESIDILRGIVMVIMALDHTRDYFNYDAFLFSATDLSRTTVAIFMTRWVSHYCAPIFMLLTGTSAFLYGEKKGKKALSRFLFTRGLFLLFLELTVINFGWDFNIHFPEIGFLVLWSLGFSMIMLSLIIYLPKKAILILGIVLVAAHNLLDSVHVSGKGIGAFGWSLLHELNDFKWGSEKIFVIYPILPWIGIISLGYSLGNLYRKDYDIQKRKKILLQIGISAILLFIILRYVNVYGDLFPWAKQSSPAFTFLSFINVTKYPPSLLYALITLGCGLVFLAYAEKPAGRAGKFFLVYGRTPMFFYILHVYLIHLIAMFATSLCGHKWGDMIFQEFTDNPQLIGYGFSLPVVYLIWISIVLILYRPCVWYNKYKTSHREKWWLSYL
jgi:uncharacterized membrane protein